MENLGTLWFDVDLDLKNLTKSIQNGKAQVLEDLKVTLSPDATELRKAIETILQGQSFKINIDAGNVDLKSVAESIRQSADAHQKLQSSASSTLDTQKKVATVAEETSKSTQAVVDATNAENAAQQKVLQTRLQIEATEQRIAHLKEQIAKNEGTLNNMVEPGRSILSETIVKQKNLLESFEKSLVTLKNEQIQNEKALKEAINQRAQAEKNAAAAASDNSLTMKQRTLLNNFQQLKENADSFQKTIENIRAKSKALGIDESKINLARQAIAGLIAQYEKFDTTKLSGGDLAEFRSQLALVKAQFRDLVSEYNQLNKAQEKADNKAQTQALKDQAAAAKAAEQSYAGVANKIADVTIKLEKYKATLDSTSGTNIPTTALDTQKAKVEELLGLLKQIEGTGGRTFDGRYLNQVMQEYGQYIKYADKAMSDLNKKVVEYRRNAAKDPAVESLKEYASLVKQISSMKATEAKVSSLNIDTAELRRNIDLLEQYARTLKQIADVQGRGYSSFITTDYINTRATATAEKSRVDLAYQMEKANNAAAQSVSRLSDAEQKLAASIKSSTDSMRGQSQVLSDLKTMATQYLSIWGAQSFVNSIIHTGGLLEQQRMSIGAILGDLSQANHLFGQITQLALKSPFGVVQLDTMSKQLTAYNFKYSELYDWTKRLADISAATGTEVSRLALALGHVRSEGALSGYTLRQFAMGNVPLLQTLSQQLGKTTAEIRKMTREKAITYDDVEKALKTLTDEGGIFANAQEVMSGALNAKFKNLHDAFDIMFGNMAESKVGDALKGIAETLTVLAKHWKDVGAILLSVAGSMGVYKLATVGINQAMLQSNVMSGQMSAKQLELMASTGKLSQKLLLQAVAAGKVTVADAEASAATFNLTKAQLEAVRTTGRTSAAFEMGAIAGGKYALKTQLLAAQFKSLSFFSIAKWATGAKLAFNGLAAGISTAATAVKGFFLAAWPLLAISAITEVWTYFSQKADDAKDRVKDLLQTANEGFKSLEKSAEQYQIGASIKMDDKMLEESVKEMDEILKSYLPQNAHGVLNEAFKIDPETGKSVHSLKEQYEMLAEELETAKEAYKEMEKIGDVLEQANNETDGGFDESFRENTEDYINALKARGNAENDFVGKHLLEIKRLIESNDDLREFAELNDAIFTISNGESGAKIEDVKGQLDLMRENYEVYQKFQTLVTQTGGELYESWGKYNEEVWKTKDAYGEVDKDLTVFTSTMKEKLVGAFGKPVEEWTEAQKLAVQKATEIFMTGIAGYSDMAEAQRIELEEKILKDFDIKINVDAREANKALTEMQAYLNDMVGNKWVVRLKLETVGSFEELYDQLDKTVKKSGETIKKLGDGISEERKRLISNPVLDPNLYDTLTDKEKEYRDAILNRNKAMETANKEGFKLSSLDKGNKKNEQANKKAESAAKKAESAAEKAAKAKTKQMEAQLKIEEELAKQRAELEDAIADATIASIENNGERERAERENEFRKQKRQIEKQAEEWKKQAFDLAKKEHEANPKNKGISFYDTKAGAAGWQGVQLTNEQIRTLEEQEKALNLNRIRQQKETEKTLISSHQSYTDKKNAIDKKYLDDVSAINAAIVEAEKRGDKEEVESLQRSLAEVAKERAKSQADLSLEQLKLDPNYIRAFEDLEKTSTETLEHLIKMFEKAKQAAAQSLAPKDLKEYTDVIRQMKDKVTERDPFKALAQSSRELKEAHEKVKKAEQELATVRKGGLILVTETDKKTGEVTSHILEQAEAEDNLRQAKDDEIKATSKYSKAQQAAFNIIEELGGSITSLGNAIGGTAGQIVSLIGDVISFASGAISALGQTTAGVSKAVQAAEKASAILAIISAALQIVTKITDILGADYEHYEKLVNQYENLIDVWNTLLEKKREYINMSYGPEVLKAGTEVLHILYKQIEAYRMLGKEALDAGASAGSHSIGVRIKKSMTSTDWDDIRSALGNIDLGDRLEGLFDLSSQQLSALREAAPMFWAKLDEDVRKYLEGIIDGAEEIDEQIKAINERLTGTSSDDIFEQMLNSLYEFADGSEDAFAEIEKNWHKMINKMVIDNAIAKNLEQDVKAWYNKLAELQKRRNGYTSEEMETINAEKASLEAQISEIEEEIRLSWRKWEDGQWLGEKGKEIDALNKKIAELNSITTSPMSDDEYKRGLEALYEEYSHLMDWPIEKVKELTEMGFIKPLEDSLGEVGKTFDSIRDAWASTVMAMKGDSASLGKEIAKIMFEALVNSNVLNDEFEAWLTGWIERYDAAMKVMAPTERESRLRQLEQERINKINELTESTQKYADMTGYAVESTEELSNSLDNLGDSLIDTLLDTEKDAAQMGAEIGKTLVREMLAEMLASEKYKTQIDAIKQLWQNVLKGGGEWTDTDGVFGAKGLTYTIDEVLERITALNNAMADDKDIQKATEAWQEYDKALQKVSEEAKESFVDMRDSFLNNLTDMEAGAESFVESVRQNMASALVEKLVLNAPIDVRLAGEDYETRFNDIDEYQEHWNERMEAAVESLRKARESGDEAAIQSAKEYIDSLIEESGRAVQAAEDNLDEIEDYIKKVQKDTTFTDMSDNFIDALMDMDGGMEDFADNMKRTIARKIIEGFMVGDRVKEILEELQKTFDYVMNAENNFSPADRVNYLLNGIHGKQGELLYAGWNTYEDEISDMQSVVTGLLEGIGLGLDKTTEVLGDFHSRFTSFLLDAEADAGSYGKEIGMALIEEMLAQMMNEKYAQQISDIRDLYRKALAGEDGITVADVIAAIRDLEAEMRADENVKALQKEYDALKEKVDDVKDEINDTTFRDLSDEWTANLMDMNATAEDFGKIIGKTLAKKIIDEFVVGKVLSRYLEAIDEAYAEYDKQLNGTGEIGTKDGFKTKEEATKELLDKSSKLIKEGIEAGEQVKPLVDMIIDYLRQLGYYDDEIEEIVEDIEEAQDTTFSGLTDSWASALVDMNTTAGDWGKKIGQTMVEKLTSELVVKKHLQPLLDDLQSFFDSAINQYSGEKGLSTAMEKATEKINNIVAKTEEWKPIIEAIAEAWQDAVGENSAFGNMHDTVLDTLMDLENGVESFRDKLNEALTKDMMERMVLDVPITVTIDGEDKVFDDFDKYAKNWNKRYLDIWNSDSKDKESMLDALIDEMVSAEESLREAAVDLRERLKKSQKDTTFKDMSDSFVSTLMDMGSTAADWASDIGKTMVNKIVEQMLVAKRIQPLLDGLQEAFDTAMTREGDNWKGVMNDTGIHIWLEKIKQEFPELQKIVEQLMKALGVDGGLKQGFSDLRGAFVSALTDMETDANRFGKDIGKTMAEQMLDAYVDKKYKTQLDKYNEQWSEALESGDPKKIEAIRQAIVKLYKQIGNDEEVVKLTKDIERLGRLADTTFKDMGDSWTSALMDMDGTAASFGVQIGRTLLQKLVDEQIVGKYLQKYLDMLQNVYQTGLDEAMPIDMIVANAIGVINQAVEASGEWKEQIDALNKAIEAIDMGTPFDNLRSSFLSTLMSMERETENFSADINKILTESFIDEFVLGDAFDRQLEYWKDEYRRINSSDLSEEERARQLRSLQDSITSAQEEYAEAARNIQDLMAYGEYQDKTAQVNMADKATYDQFELYLGIATSQQIAMEQGNSVRQQILATLHSMEGLMSGNDNLLTQAALANSHLQMIRYYNWKMYELMDMHMGSIDDKLSKLRRI